MKLNTREIYSLYDIKFREREGYSIVQQEMIIIFHWIFFIGSDTLFLHIQIRLHHPHGVVNKANGAWACNDIQWRKCIDKMNSFTINELESAAMRTRSTRYSIIE